MADHEIKEIKGARCLHIGATGRLEFQLEDGRIASVACDVLDAPAPVPGAPSLEEIDAALQREAAAGARESARPGSIFSVDLGGEGDPDAQLEREREAHRREGERQKATGEGEGGPKDPPPALKGKLPDDFPGHAALVEAGINTYGQLRKAGDVTAIAGIGPATAEKITAALAAAPADDAEE